MGVVRLSDFCIRYKNCYKVSVSGQINILRILPRPFIKQKEGKCNFFFRSLELKIKNKIISLRNKKKRLLPPSHLTTACTIQEKNDNVKLILEVSGTLPSYGYFVKHGWGFPAQLPFSLSSPPPCHLLLLLIPLRMKHYDLVISWVTLQFFILSLRLN